MEENNNSNVLGIQATISSADIEKGANDFIRKVTEMEKATDKATEAMSVAFDKLDGKIKSLSSSLSENKSRLEDIISSLQSYKPTDSVTQEVFDKLKDEYENALGVQKELEQQLESSRKKIDEQRDAMERLADANRKASTSYKSENEISSKDVDDSERIRKIKEELKELNKSLKDNEKQYEANSAKLDEYDAKLMKLYAAEERGVKNVMRGNASVSIGESISENEKAYEELRKQQAAVTAEIDEQKEKQLALNRELDAMTKKPASVQSLLKSITDEMRRMVQNGEDGSERFRELAEEAAKLKEEAKQVNAEMASEQKGSGFAAAAEGINTLSGALTFGLGVASLFGAEEENLAKIQTKLQSAMAITMGLQQASQVLMSGSILKTKLLTTAQSVHTAVLRTATRVTTMFGLSAKAASVAVTGFYAACTLGLSLIIPALISLYSKLSSRQQKLAEVTKEGVAERKKEHEELEAILKVLKDEKITKEQLAAAQEKLNEKVEHYVAIAKDDKRTTLEQSQAYEVLKRIVPELTTQYSLLELQAIDTALALKLINEENDKTRFNKATSDLEKYNSILERYNNRELTQEDKDFLSEKYGSSKFDNWKKNLEKDIADADNIIKDYQAMQDNIKPVHIQLIEVDSQIDALTKERDAAKRFRDEIDQEKDPDEFGYWSGLFQELDNKINILKAKRKEIVGDTTFEEAKADWEAADKRFYEIEQNRSKYSDREYREAKALKDDKAAIFQSLGGDTSKTYEKQMSEEKRLADERKKQQEQIGKEFQDVLLANKQAEINLIQDEDERKLAQIKLNYEKEKAEIERQRKEWEKAQGGQLTEEQEAALNQRSMFAAQKYVNDSQKVGTDKLEREARERQEHYDELLKAYQTYKNAEKQINEKYDKDSENLKKAGGTDENQAILEKKRRSALEQAAEEFALQSEVYQQWLSEIEGMTLERLEGALSEAELALELARAKGSSSEDLAVAIAKVNKLRNVIKNTDDISPKQRSVEEWKALSDVISEASGVFEELGDSIGDTAGEILKSVGSIGSSTVGLINNITQLTQMSIEGTKETANTASKSVQAVEKASVILAIISAAIQIITKIINLGKQLHNAKYEKAIEASQDKIDDLSKSYEQLSEKVDEAFGNTRVQALKDMNANLERQNALIRQQMEDEAQVKQKDKEYETAMDEYNARLEENQKKQEENKKAMEEAIFGEDIQSAIENFAEAYAEALGGNMDMNATAKEQAVRMMKNMVMESIKEYVAGSKKMEQIRAKMDALYADGVFSAADQKLIINELEQFNKELDDRFGWAEDLFSEDKASSSSSSKRGIATASQESVDENNGRLMSIQLSMGEITTLQRLTQADTAAIRHDIAVQNRYISEIIDIQYDSLSYLSSIDKNTKELYQINTRLGQIEANTRQTKR